MKRFVSYAAALAILALPGHVRAQDGVTFQDGDQIKMVGTADAVVAAWGGVYLGPYAGQLVSDPTQPMFTMYCVDFSHEVSRGEVWTINESNIGGGDLSQTRLGNAGLGTYSQVAYLASLFDSWDLLAPVSYDGVAGHTFASYYASKVSNKTYMWSGIHAAIWKLTSGGISPTNAVATGLASPFLAYAALMSSSGFGGLDMAEWSLLTPVDKDNPASAQEMLVRTPGTTVTPEPDSYVLLATGMLFLFALARRKQIREISDA
jgi:hypothetical protein